MVLGEHHIQGLHGHLRTSFGHFVGLVVEEGEFLGLPLKGLDVLVGLDLPEFQS